MATAVLRQEHAGVYTLHNDDTRRRPNAEKRRSRAGKAQIVEADGTKVYPRLYFTELALRLLISGEEFTLYKFGMSKATDPREVSSAVIKFYGWTVSSVFDFHLDGPDDIALGDVVVKLVRAIEKKVHDILQGYCWEGVFKGTVGAKNGHTETYLLPMTIAKCLIEVLSGINSWLAGHEVELNELHALRISGSKAADDKFAELASTFCRPLEERVSRQSTPPPPLVEAVFRRLIEQKFPFGIPHDDLAKALNELAEDTILAFTPLGAAANVLKQSFLIPRLCDLMKKYGVFETSCHASTSAVSDFGISAKARYGGKPLASKPPRSSQGAGLRPSLPAARASLGSALPMPRAPMPRMSDGALLPRALAGLRVSAGAGAQVPPRIPRPSGSVPVVLPLAPAVSVYR